MKINQSEKRPFKPVTLTLETQDEVDGMYAFLRNTCSDVFGFVGVPHCELEPFLIRSPDKVFELFAEKSDAFVKRRAEHL